MTGHQHPRTTLGPWLIALGLVLCFVLGASQGVRAGPGPEEAETPGSTGAGFGPHRFGTAVYPAQEIPLRFNHAKHLAKGIGCEKCHDRIAKSKRASDHNFPTGEACDECHGAQHPLEPGVEANCGLCHTSLLEGDPTRVTAGLIAPPPLLRFNHQLHASKGASCEDCHRNMDRVRLATTLQLPTEDDCLKCHDGVGATDKCSACHPAGPDGKLILRHGSTGASPPLVPRARTNWGAAHTLDFVRDHATTAKSNPALCETCHDDDQCQDCHNGVLRPMRIHAADYLTSHAVDARARTADCQSCHRMQNDCLACHDRVGLSPGTESSSFGPGSSLRYHPAGFAGPPGTPQSHAFAAQRNMNACASCHSEDTCLACHATTSAASPGLNVNPHGRGFASSARCGALARTNRRACLKCHAPGDLALQCVGPG